MTAQGAGEDVGGPYIAFGNVNGTAALENSRAVSPKNKHALAV